MSSTCKTTFRNLLKPFYVYPWVSSWAFENLLTSPFHHDYLLPIHLFQNPIIIRGEARYYEPYVSTVLNTQCEGHNGFIPAYTNDNMTIGYSLAFPSDFEKLANKMNRSPFNPPFIARFILDHSTNTLIMIIPSAKHQVFSIAFFGITNNSQYTFIVPAKEYTWDSLPDDPLIGFVSFATSPHMINIDGTQYDFELPNTDLRQINETDVTPKDVADLMSNLSISSNHKNSSTSNHTSSTCMTVPSLDYQRIVRILSDFQQVNQIKFTSSNFILSKIQQTRFEQSILMILNKYNVFVGDRIDTNPVEVPGYDFMIQVRSYRHYFEASNMTIRQAMGSKCAQVYYSATLSLTADYRLLEKPLKEKETRAKILEERRKRNRLSAARSYEQKKQALKKMEEELESCKIVVKKLEQRHEIEYEKNRQLKSMVKLLVNESP